MKNLNWKAEVHPCFDQAFLFLGITMAPPTDIRLVHAVIEPPGLGRSAHAWVENLKDDTAVLGQDEGRHTLYATMDRIAFREKVKILYDVAYTPERAVQMARTHQSFGPWDDRILEFMTDSAELPKSREATG